MIIPALVILLLALASALVFERYRHRREFGRLEEAIRKQDRRLLGSEDYERAPQHVRTLERAIFEQLFTAENLEESIVRREELLSSLVDGLGDAVIVTDRKNKIRFANEKALQIFMLKDDVVGSPVRKALAHGQLIGWLALCHTKAKSTHTRLDLPGRMLEGGRDRSFEVDVAPLQENEFGGSDVSRIVLHDVTEREELDRVRKDFVANASHELRTPLTIINGYLENLLDDGAVDDPVITKRFLGVMRKHGNRLALLVEDMLTISKLESDENEHLELFDFDFANCVGEVLDRLSPVIESKGAIVSVEIPEEKKILCGDRLYWDQILFNLLENALKENDEQGLRLTVKREDDKEETRILVSDNGVGIPNQALPFIFKRFYRVDESHASHKTGTGLGLSIVRRAVEAQGGTIEASSTPGEDTTFTIKLPKER